MFGKRSKQQPKQDTRREPQAAGPATAENEGAGESKRPNPAGNTPQPSAPVRPDAPARPDPSAVLNRQPTPPVNPDAGTKRAAGNRQGNTKAESAEGEADNKLIVGQHIRMSGEIAACDKLLVEGRVEADLTQTRELEIAPTGSFKGSAVIDVAEIAGHFEGDLVVRERLNLRANGQVQGTIRYRALEIESGGRIGGTLVELSAEEAERYREDETARNASGEPAADDGAVAPASEEPGGAPAFGEQSPAANADAPEAVAEDPLWRHNA